MITKSNVVEYLFKVEPEFVESLAQSESGNTENEGWKFILFSHFVTNRLKQGEYRNAKNVFNAIEHLLEKGVADEEVQTLVTTCFLENIVNHSANGEFSASFFVPFLGPKSIEYCKSSDEFWGTETPGINKDKK